MLDETKLKHSWRAMMARCYKRAKKSQKSYWGKGVTVCDEWHKYVNFKCWALDNGYEIGLSIDRVDLDGNYCPENCRWITISENSRYKSNTVLNKEMILKIWEYFNAAIKPSAIAKLLNVKSYLVYAVVYGNSWSGVATNNNIVVKAKINIWDGYKIKHNIHKPNDFKVKYDNDPFMCDYFKRQNYKQEYYEFEKLPHNLSWFIKYKLTHLSQFENEIIYYATGKSRHGTKSRIYVFYKPINP